MWNWRGGGVCLTVAVQALAAAPGSDFEAALDRQVAALMRSEPVPGVSVGVIQDGQVRLMKAYGVRHAGTGQPMTPETLMAIGSNTKSFTGVLSAMLVDDGKLDLDRPLQAHVPELRLKDAYAAQHLSMRDVLAHRSGLPDPMPALWGPNFPDRPTVMQILANLEPTASFRGQFQYNNTLYILASHVQAQLAAQPWEDLLAQRLLKPLGMNASTARLKEAQASGNVATGHHGTGPFWPVVPHDGYYAVGAGAIYSNVPDMLRYLQFRLDGYRVGGRALVSERMARELDQPVVISTDRAIPYGLGVQFIRHGPHVTVFHEGGIDGFVSKMVWVPERKLGVVILTNAQAEVVTPLSDWILTQWLGVPSGQAPKVMPPPPPPVVWPAPAMPPFAPLSAYTGRYVKAMTGAASVEMDGGKLFLRYGRKRAELRHAHGNVFIAQPDDPARSNGIDFLAGLALHFSGSALDPVSRFEVVMTPGTHALQFDKQAPSGPAR